jgi:hypothetical protein
MIMAEAMEEEEMMIMAVKERVDDNRA